MLKVKVCCGTSCYIMGSSELINQDIYNGLEVDIEGSTCMNLCKDGDKRPPYVAIEGKVYSRVTPDSLKELIKERLDVV